MSGTRLLVATVLLFAAAPAAMAQSLFSARGLGVPVAAVDARTAALGGIGVGLIGFHQALTNPAEMAGVTRRGVSAVLQPVSTSADVAGVRDGTTGTRFPLINIVYPLTSRLVATVGYGAFLEQSWGVEMESVAVIGDRTYEVRDVQRSVGGIAQLRAGAAYEFSESFSVGAAAGLLTGGVQRTATRSFADSIGDLQPISEQLNWHYHAPIGAIGMRLDLGGQVRLAASALVGGELEATGRTAAAGDRTYGAPLELSAGASAHITPLLLATAGTVWSRMPATQGETLRRETLRVGGGLEYQGLRSGLRTFPLRLGGHWAQLPYYRSDETAAAEWGAAAGIGFRLGDPVDPAAVADIAIERGGRSGLVGPRLADGVSESHWRFNLSLALFAR